LHWGKPEEIHLDRPFWRVSVERALRREKHPAVFQALQKLKMRLMQSPLLGMNCGWSLTDNLLHECALLLNSKHKEERMFIAEILEKDYLPEVKDNCLCLDDVISLLVKPAASEKDPTVKDRLDWTLREYRKAAARIRRGRLAGQSDF
jgi:hypothetical protein